jgi:hypothetical protein
VKCNVKKLNIVLNRNYSYDTLVPCFSWRKCHRKFHRKYPDSTVPCKAMIHDIVTELHSKELVLGAEMS